MTRQEEIRKLAAERKAVILAHNYTRGEVQDVADYTGDSLELARENAAREIIVGTETGILHRLRKENPGKAFYPVSERMVCPNMKTTTLDNLAECLREMKTVVTVPSPLPCARGGSWRRCSPYPEQ